MGITENSASQSAATKEKRMTIKAMYQDKSGQRFTGEIVKGSDGAWTLSTGHALDYFIEAADVVGGYVEFYGFDVPDSSITQKVDGGVIVDGDFIRWPVKPESADSRLPNENSHQQLQRIAANRDAEQHRMQERERLRVLNELNQPNSRIGLMAQAARRHRSEIAVAMKKTGDN